MPNHIKKLRLDAGLTQDELGALVETSGQQIARLENGERGLTLDWIEKLAPALGVPLCALIEDTPNRQPQGDGEFINEIDELALVRLWRRMPQQTKVAILTLARAAAESSPEISELNDLAHTQPPGTYEEHPSAERGSRVLK